MIYEQFGELKFQYRHREFWCHACYVGTGGRNKTKTAEYIRHHLAEDKLEEQLCIPYSGIPFMGRRQQKFRWQTVHASMMARMVRKPYRGTQKESHYGKGKDGIEEQEREIFWISARIG